MPQLPRSYFALVTSQILSDDNDHLSLFETMFSHLEADLQKSFKDHLFEKFKIFHSQNIVNIYSKYCNLMRESEDFETLVSALYKTK